MQVTVGDENDNNPTFTNLPNETSVSEGAATTTAFYVVTVCILKFKMTIEHSGSFVNYGTAICFLSRRLLTLMKVLMHL